MINKNKSQRWVKIVAWLVAISFGLGMTLLLVIPTPNKTSSPAPASQTSSTPITGGEAAAGAIGQGDLAMKSGNIDQAISFYETAYGLDKKDKAIQKKLANAYKTYLQLSPDGPKAKQVKTALENL